MWRDAGTSEGDGSRRTHAIGLRVALGGEPEADSAVVVVRGLATSLSGAAIGLAAAFELSTRYPRCCTA